MNRIVLPGLIGSHPLGALVAFGLLRVLSREMPEVRLSFVEEDDWIAVLHADLPSEAALIDHLVSWASTDVPPALAVFGEKDVRVPPEAYRRILQTALAARDEELVAFLVALAADGAEDRSKHLIKPSPFYMASGQQSFVQTMKRIHQRSQDRARWEEALCGPWTYATEEWSAGWDPGTERLHALRAQAPTKDKTTCVAGAVRLAFEALPLFPTFSIAGIVHTVGWVRKERLERFRWPIPALPVSVETLAVLLASKDVLDPPEASASTPERGDITTPTPRRPTREGIAAIYESVRHEFGQGYAVFRPARRLL